MYGTDPTLKRSKAQIAEANAETARDDLNLLIKRVAFETAERFHDEIGKLEIQANWPLQELAESLADIMTDSVFWPDPEQAAFDAHYGERR